MANQPTMLFEGTGFEMTGGQAMAGVGAISSIGNTVTSILASRNARIIGKQNARLIREEAERQSRFRSIEAAMHLAEVDVAYATSGISGNVVEAVRNQEAMLEQAAVSNLERQGELAAWRAKQQGLTASQAAIGESVSAVQSGALFAYRAFGER